MASALLAGMCIGFLPHNIYPARIFMGDIGAMLLGLLLAYGPISSTDSLDPALLTNYSRSTPWTGSRRCCRCWCRPRSSSSRTRT